MAAIVRIGALTTKDIGEAEGQAIPLPNVSGVILDLVIKYATHHRDDPPPPTEDETRPKTSDDINDWDRDFMRVDQGILFELILAANYLDMKNLLDLGCKTVANMIKGKSVDEIRKTFNIVNDFTPEEEEQIRKEVCTCHDWPQICALGEYRC